MPGIYAADGSLNVSVVTGTSGSQRGIYAANGSINVVVSPGTGLVGAYHKSGAWYVTYTTTNVNSLRAPDGSIYVTTSPYVKGAMKVTAVSGSFVVVTSGTPTYYIYGF